MCSRWECILGSPPCDRALAFRARTGMRTETVGGGAAGRGRRAGERMLSGRLQAGRDSRLAPRGTAGAWALRRPAVPRGLASRSEWVARVGSVPGDAPPQQRRSGRLWSFMGSATVGSSALGSSRWLKALCGPVRAVPGGPIREALPGGRCESTPPRRIGECVSVMFTARGR